MYEVKLEKFEGPLNLLLQLIEKEDLDINQISLARIADEYINYINSQKNIPLEELSDFLLIASKLLYIKSKSLLPYLVWDDKEDEPVDLENQLKIYKEFLDASQKIEGLIKEKNFLFSRSRAIVPKGFYPPQKITKENLKSIFSEILGQLEPLVKKGKEIKEEIISIHKKIEELKENICKQAQFGFNKFIKKAKNKTEMIVNFLALLELMKQRIIIAKQDSLFKEITIIKNKNA